MTIAYAASISWEKHRILTGIGGVISLLLGVYLFINPDAGTALIIMILGIFFVISGIISLAMSCSSGKNKIIKFFSAKNCIPDF